MKIFSFISAILITLFVSGKAVASETVYEENLNYCGNTLKEKGFGSTKTMSMGFGIYLPQIADYSGNSITKVRVGMKATVSDVTIFIADDINGTPLYEQTVKQMSNGWNDVELTTPFALDGKPLYVGYRTNVEARVYPIGVTEKDFTENAFYLNTGSGFSDKSDTYSPLALQVIVAGSQFVKHAAAVESMRTMYVLSGTEPTTSITIANKGVEPISSIDLTLNVAGTEVSRSIQGLNIPRYEKGSASIALPKMDVGSHAISCSITKVNGENFTDTNAFSHPTKLIVCSESWPRKVVCEELTGTNCGWCPQGIVLFEEMRIKHPEDFIAIAVHLFNESDPMYIPDYKGIWNFGTAAPNFVINRNAVLAESKDVENAFSKALQQFNWTKMDVKVDNVDTNSKTINITTTMEFAANQQAPNYRLCFVVIENNVSGTGCVQANNYAGGGNGEMGGWEKLASYVPTTYNDVARSIDSFYGIEGCIPDNIEKNKAYEYSHSMKISSVSNVDNAEVVALILNGETGEIINAAKTALSSSAVESISASNSSVWGGNGSIHWKGCSNACIYNLNGALVMTANGSGNAPLAPGCYIVKMQGNNASKVIVK